MAGKILRVLARGTASVPVHGAHARGQSRFVGRVHDFDLGTPFVATDELGAKSAGVMPALVCSPEPHVVRQDDDPSEFSEQMLHLRYGDLWPFDEETAIAAGVPFDPDYGGEYATVCGGDELVNVAHQEALASVAKAAPTKPSLSPPRPTAKPVTPAPVAEEK